MIDGGPGQVESARKALEDIGLLQIPLIGIAKGEGRRVGAERIIFADQRKPLQLSLDHFGFRLLLEIRDEAHRFAVAGHRSRRAKPRRESQLDSIKGIGQKRRKQLIARFGSLSGVNNATLEELSAMPGIGPSLAEKIYQALH